MPGRRPALPARATAPFRRPEPVAARRYSATWVPSSSLAVADGAAGDRHSLPHVVLLPQLVPQLPLGVRLTRGRVGHLLRLPGHAEDFFLRPEVGLRVPVAPQAPLHE